MKCMKVMKQHSGNQKWFTAEFAETAENDSHEKAQKVQKLDTDLHW